MSPMIPTDPDSLPLEYEVVPDETLVRGVIREFKVAEKTDKNGKHYGSLTWEVITPIEYEGRQLTDNYVGFQDEIDPTMNDGQKRRSLEKGIKFNRICACVGLKPSMIPSNPITTPDELDEVNQFLADEFIGQEGDFNVYIDTYKGRKNNKIRDYFLP